MISLPRFPVILRMGSMFNRAQSTPLADQSSGRPESTASHRRRPLRVFIVHRDADTVDACLEELKKGQFAVTADLALNLAQCAEYLQARSHDLIIAEYPGPNWKRSQALPFVDQNGLEIPLLFLTKAGNISNAQLSADGACDFVEQEHLSQLPMAVRRILNEKKLREELEETRSALRHSQSLYRALALSAVMGMLTFRPKSDLSGTASSILAPSVVVPPWIRTLVYLLELRMRVFGAVRRNRPFLYARQTLRTWVAEFKRDWIAMMEAVEFPQVRKTLLQWLRQPAASKRMDAERKQPV
jgi:AmiR/NasT family two-component response regulator